MSALGTILVVDDEPNLLDAIAECLEREGHKVLRASDAESALALAAQAPDAGLIDINLPDLSGPEVVRRMECTFPLRFMTADATESERKEAQQVSGQAALQKPLSPNQIKEAVAQLLALAA